MGGQTVSTRPLSGAQGFFPARQSSYWTFFCLNLLYVTLPHANRLTALILFDQ